MTKNISIMRKLMVVLMAVMVVFTYSVATSSDVYAATKLTVKPASKTINAGKTVKLTANKKAKWSVVKGKSVAKITTSKKAKSVKVKGLKAGKAVIKVKAGTKSKKITVTVIPALKVTPSAKVVKTGDDITIKSNNSVKWSISSGKDYASLSDAKAKSVTLNGKEAGTVVVKATDAKTGSYKKVSIVVVKYAADEATIDEVSEFMFDNDPATELIDARVQEAYAGWKMDGAKNGGRLKNAGLFSARYIDCVYPYSPYNPYAVKRETAIQKYMDAAGLESTDSVIVYDYAGNGEAAAVADYLHDMGFKKIKTFDAKAMIDAGSNLEQDDNYQMYLPTSMVKDISDYITGKDTTLEPTTTAVIKESDMDKVILFDVGYGNVNESDYLTTGHVPGAIHMNTNAYERPRIYVPEKREKYGKEYSLISLEEFRDDLCPQYGITKDSIVIATSDDQRPIARFGYMLKSLGVEFYGMSGLKRVWQTNEYALDTENIEEPTSVASFGSNTIPNPDEIVWMDEVKAMLKANQKNPNNHTAGTLVGIKSTWGGTYSYHDLIGEVPGGFIPNNLVEFFNVDGTPIPKSVMLASYEAEGIPTDKPIVHYCGDGWGASSIAYAAQSVGLDNVKYWGEGIVVWTNRGNWFQAYDGRLYKYDKDLDAVVDVDGDIIVDENIMKLE